MPKPTHTFVVTDKNGKPSKTSGYLRLTPIAKRLALAYALFFVLTALYPCQLSYPNVKRQVLRTFSVATLEAQGGGGSGAGSSPCDCNEGFSGNNYGMDGKPLCKDCNYDEDGSYFGCGPGWFYSCDGYGTDLGIFF